MSEWNFGFHRIQRPSVMAANAMYLLSTAGIVLLSAAVLAVRVLFPDLSAQMVSLNGTVAYEALILLLPALIYRRGHPGIDAALRLNRPKAKHIAIAAFAAGVGLLLSNYLGILWDVLIQSLGGRLTDSSMVVGAGPWGLLSALLSIGVMPAICEELVFRGVMLGSYERNGTLRAVVLTGLLFALLHGSVQGFPIHLMLGLALGYLAVNTDSIFVPMVYHFTHNAGSVLMSLADSGANPFDPSESLYHYIGGAAGMTQVCILLAVTGVIYALLLLMASSDREMMGLPFGVPRPAAREQSGWQASLVLMAGVVTAGVLMLLDLLTVMRVVA